MINGKKEKITGVIPALSTGWLGRQSYNLIITDHRLIIAKYSSELMKKEQEKVAAEAENKGFFGRWKASISTGLSFHERYYEMDPEAILEEDEDNYEIMSNEIGSIKIKANGWNQGQDKNRANEMTIEWTKGKEKYKFDRMNPKKVKEALKPLLGTKIN